MHFKFLKRMIKRLAKSKIAGDQIGCGGRGTMVVLNKLPQFLEKKTHFHNEKEFACYGKSRQNLLNK